MSLLLTAVGSQAPLARFRGAVARGRRLASVWAGAQVTRSGELSRVVAVGGRRKPMLTG
jgi:hypothetical protein